MERTTKTRSTASMRWSFLLALFLMLAALPPAAAETPPGSDAPPVRQPDANPLVRCNPLSVTAYVGQTAVIDLYMENVVNLYGADLRVSYNPAIGQVQDADLFAPGAQIQPLYLWTIPGFIVRNGAYGPGDIPPNCGVACLWFAFTQLNPTPPANGAGPVARVTFLGLQAGTFPMNWINHQLSAPGGVPITPVDNQSCSVTFIDPLAVTLASFEATQQGEAVLVSWETVSELKNAGFNLYRSESAAAPQTLLGFTPSQGPGSAQGFTYSYLDAAAGAQPGQTWYYWLEDVDLNGATTLHGPVSVTFVGPTAVTQSGMQADSAPTGLSLVTTTLALLLGLAAALAASRGRRGAAASHE